MAFTEIAETFMPHALLRKGIDALAMVPACYPGSWFHGHFGAAMLAAHYIAAHVETTSRMSTLVTAAAERFETAEHALFTEPVADAEIVAVTPILAALERTIGTLSTDGHGAIYASLALKTFRVAPELATASRIAGVVRLIENAQHDDPYRYFGTENYKTDALHITDVPRFSTVTEAMRFALYDHDVVYPDQVLNGRYYYLAGSRLHTITHAHALLELDMLGYGDIAQLGLPALRKQLQLCKPAALPAALKPLESEQRLDPWTDAFWMREKADTHHVKLAYAVMSACDLLGIQQKSRLLQMLSVYWSTLP